MGYITVWDTIKDPVGNPEVEARILIDLVANWQDKDPGVEFVIGGQYSVLQHTEARTDNLGYYELNLQTNSDYAPVAGTMYRVQYQRTSSTKPDLTFHILLPATSGRYWVWSLLAMPPSGPPGSGGALYPEDGLYPSDTLFPG